MARGVHSRRSFLHRVLGLGLVAVLPRATLSGIRANARTTRQPGITSLEWREVVAFQGDFGDDVVAPKGIEYNEQTGRLIVSLSPHFHPDTPRLLNVVDFDGQRSRFAPGLVLDRPGGEALLVVVPSTGPPVQAGFVPGDVFVNSIGDRISRLSARGDVLADPWVDLSAGGKALWGGLTFDTVGMFGGGLIALTELGTIFSISAAGVVRQIADLAHTNLGDLGPHPEGILVAPAGFGPVAGHILIGIEGVDQTPNSGAIYALDATGNARQVASIRFGAESFAYAPAYGGTYFQCELDFGGPRLNRLLSISAAQLLELRGQILAANEFDGELWAIGWDGKSYRSRRVAGAPQPWTTQGYAIEGTELEAGIVAAAPPVSPTWSDWTAIPGSPLGSHLPTAYPTRAGHLYAVKVRTDGRLFRARRDAASRSWSVWSEVEPGGFVTALTATAMVYEETLYVLAVALNGRLMITRTGQGAQWMAVPNAPKTAVPAAAAIAGGRLAVCVVSKADGNLYLNELHYAGRQWTGWGQIPGGKVTHDVPALGSFQNELWVFVRSTKGTVHAAARLASGRWTPWSELPGGGPVVGPLSAAGSPNPVLDAGAANGQLYVFARRQGQTIVNIASLTGTWSGWQPLGGTPGAVAPAFAPNPNRLFLLRLDSGQLQERHTLSDRV
jgi:hypothetical protein